jgi:hypothetical protein
LFGGETTYGLGGAGGIVLAPKAKEGSIIRFGTAIKCGLASKDSAPWSHGR